ncbi:hypothetical protein EI94DRAFT_1739508 [Lactarius quietus]|nr:hypothetical protein EI94DRAFT_1739508 [Lactarius quietus]
MAHRDTTGTPFLYMRREPIHRLSTFVIRSAMPNETRTTSGARSQGWRVKSSSSPEKCNLGIGFLSANRLYARGATVYLYCLSKARECGNGGDGMGSGGSQSRLRFLELDLPSLDSLHPTRAVVKFLTIGGEAGRLDSVDFSYSLQSQVSF